MRDIKFRGKTLENFSNDNTNIVIPKEKWIYGGITYDTDRIWIDTPYYGQIIVNKETIGQYTGLKDKNGKEIYEGDILELNKDGRIFYGTSDGLLAKKYQLVGFKDGAFMTCRNKYLIDDYDTYLWIICKYSIVAGNIYDNKNLIEEGEQRNYE